MPRLAPCFFLVARHGVAAVLRGVLSAPSHALNCMSELIY